LLMMRHLEAAYPICVLVKVSFIAVYLYMGTRIDVITRENLGIITGFLRRPQDIARP